MWFVISERNGRFFHGVDEGLRGKMPRGSSERAPVYVKFKPKDSDEVALQQLPSNFVINFEERMAQPSPRASETRASRSLRIERLGASYMQTLGWVLSVLHVGRLEWHQNASSGWRYAHGAWIWLHIPEAARISVRNPFIDVQAFHREMSLTELCYDTIELLAL